MTTRRTPSNTSSAFKPKAGRGLRRLFALLLVAGLSGAAVSSISRPVRADQAQLAEQERDREAESIARSIMSPFCPGRTVSGCPNAGPWRDDIRKWVGEGVSAEEIRRRLHERVPEHNLMGVPPNRLGWLLPVGSALLAVAALVFALRYLLKSGKGGGPPSGGGKGDDPGKPPAPSPSKVDYDARLADELESLEQ